MTSIKKLPGDLGLVAVAIRSLLSESPRLFEARLHAFQLFRWIYTGGPPGSSFHASSLIYGAAELQILKKNLKHKVAAINGYASQHVHLKEINALLEGARYHANIYSSLTYNLDALRSETFNNYLKDFEKVFKLADKLLSLKVGGHELSTNNVHRLIGGRSNLKTFRSRYKYQLGFLHAAKAFDFKLLFFLREGDKRRILSPVTLIDRIGEQLADKNRLRDFLAHAKAVIASIDPALSDKLSQAWPELQAANVSITELNDDELEKVQRRPRRPATTRRTTKRQEPISSKDQP